MRAHYSRADTCVGNKRPRAANVQQLLCKLFSIFSLLFSPAVFQRFNLARVVLTRIRARATTVEIVTTNPVRGLNVGYDNDMQSVRPARAAVRWNGYESHIQRESTEITNRIILYE